MPVNNTQGSFNVGRDCRVVIVLDGIGQIDVPNLTQFDCKQETAAVKSDRLDGIQMHAELQKGWTGSFEFDRGDATLDRAIARMESLWLDSGVVTGGTIYQYILEAGRTTTKFQFDNCAFKLDDAGTWKGDSQVKQKLTFMANRRREV